MPTVAVVDGVVDRAPVVVRILDGVHLDGGRRPAADLGCARAEAAGAGPTTAARKAGNAQHAQAVGVVVTGRFALIIMFFFLDLDNATALDRSLTRFCELGFAGHFKTNNIKQN